MFSAGERFGPKTVYKEMERFIDLQITAKMFWEIVAMVLYLIVSKKLLNLTPYPWTDWF